MQTLRLAGLALAAALLGGCASGPGFIEATVQSSAATTPGGAVLQNVRYRFGTEPVIAGQPSPAELQPLAQAALFSVGARMDDANPNVRVDITGSVHMGYYDDWNGWGLPPADWGDPDYFGWGMGVGDGWFGNDGYGWPGGDYQIPIYVTEVTLAMRDIATGQIIYDTRARHSGTSADTQAVLAALYEAALRGYPNPPAGTQHVDISLAPQQTPIQAEVQRLEHPDTAPAAQPIK